MTNIDKLIDSLTWRDIKDAPRDGTVIKCKGSNDKDYYARWNWSPNAQVNTWCGEVQGIVLPITPEPQFWQHTNLPTGQAGEVIKVLRDALKHCNKELSGYGYNKAIGITSPLTEAYWHSEEALAEAERIAGGGDGNIGK